jgi:DNA mismatch repair protein MutS
MSDENLTPMMQQYRRMRQEVPPDALMFFRLGDFFELFFEDAKEASALLDLTLTQRHGTPMCGIPFHTSEGYIARLIKLGKRVAICDQMEAPKPGQVVRREITQIISPGSVLDSGLLSSKANNYCAAVSEVSGKYGIAYLDLSTGEFRAGEVETWEGVEETLSRINGSEVIVPSEGSMPDIASSHPYEAWTFAPENARFTLLEQFKVQSLDGFGLTPHLAAIGAAGALVHYITHELRRSLTHIPRISTFQRDDVLILDPMTRRNLELVEPLRESKTDTTVLKAIDRTATSGGGRMLRQWLLQPLRNLGELRARQGAVAYFSVNELERERIRSYLREVKDLERLIARLALNSGNARDLAALKLSLKPIPDLKSALQSMEAPLIQSLGDQLIPQPDLVELLEKALVDEPPMAIKEGGMIREGYRPELDELKSASTQGKEWLARLQAKEQERTGIKSLKIRYNQVFGYYIEITKTNLDSVPDDYIRKQTLVNAERYITPELKEMEGKILGAEERSRQLEYEFFLELRQSAVAKIGEIQSTAGALSALDVLAGWGSLAQEQNYVRPELEESERLEIVEGRHPVIEQILLNERFVPNDTLLDSEKVRTIILTGPNMAGKSTYIRQVALISILAHTGCFVPAKKAVVGLLDRVFTRVGASDDLSRGQSTFMMEMTETANILNHASPKSLVILDEIGRGTSTFDGLSIAWSVAEYLHQQLQSRTLFATHYHELTELAQLLPAVKNHHVAVREWNDQVIFLRKIVEGGTDKSYGIQVARLAGLPVSVLDRAKEILRNLEEGELDESGKPKIGRRKSGGAPGEKAKKTKDQSKPEEWDLFKFTAAQENQPKSRRSRKEGDGLTSKV